MILPGLSVLLGMQAPPPVQPAPPRHPVQASVLLVRSRLGGMRIHQGSGVVVAPGLVATNAHVAEGSLGLTVHQGAASWVVARVKVDPDRDLCLLTVPGLTAPAAVTAEPTGPGQAVMAVGYPGGQGPVVSRGHLRGIWYHGDGRLLQSDALTLPGNSGGGLFDEEGHLLGLTTMTFTPSPRLNFSVPVAWIQELIAGPGGTPGHRPQGNWADQGADMLERLAQDPRNWPTWEAAARQWVAELPQDANAWLALGLALDRSARAAAEAGRGASPAALAEGVEAYRRSLALRQEPRTWNNLGVALDLLNRFGEAEHAFAEALALEPTYALAWLNLGVARMNARRFQEAEQALQRGLALRPDEAPAWVRLGYCQRALGQRETAAATFQVALRYRPLAAELWLDRGLLLAELGRVDEAREIQARLATLNPELAGRLEAALKKARRS